MHVFVEVECSVIILYYSPTMTKTTKAVLLAAFVFPGAGHIGFKKYFSATVFIATACAATIVIMSFVFTKAKSIADRIVSGEVPADIMVIRELITNQQHTENAQLANTATTVLIVVWLISIADAYRIGRAAK